MTTQMVAEKCGIALLAAMITPGEIRAARAYLQWTRQQLADNAKLALNSITRLEKGEVDPRNETLMAVRRAFERHGIEFLSLIEGKEGIRIRKPIGVPERPRRTMRNSKTRESQT